MTKEVLRLITELGEEIEALIEARSLARVDENLAALRAVIAGGRGVVPTSPARHRAKPSPARDAKVAKKGGPGPKPRFTEAEQRAIVQEAMKFTAKSDKAVVAKRFGISVGQIYKWTRDIGIERRRFTREYKLDLVAKARAMAPGDREMFLDSEKINKSTYHTWTTWAKGQTP